MIASIGSWIFVAAPGAVDFQAHDIDSSFRGGYAVSVADFNKDGKLDVIANSLRVQEVGLVRKSRLAKARVVGQTPQIVNQAMADIDGDGIPEVAFESSFAMQAGQQRGNCMAGASPGDPASRGRSTSRQIPDVAPYRLGRLDGDGKPELVNAPLLGPKGLAPTYDQDLASVFWYGQKDWKRHLVADNIPGIIHRVRPVEWEGTNAIKSSSPASRASSYIAQPARATA